MKFVPSGIRSALSHADYRLFIAGQIVVMLGFWMQNIASSWLIYRITGSSLLLGTVSICATLPSLVLSPFAGILADKFPKKYILYFTLSIFMTSSFTMSFLIRNEYIQIWHILVNATLFGTAMAIETPARGSFIVELVGKADLQNAIALNASVFNFGRLVGPAIGGALLPIIGEGWLYFANGCAIAWLFYSVYKIRALGLPIPPEDDLKHSASEGYVFAYKEKAVRYALMLLGFGAIFIIPVSVLLPVLSVEILNGDSRLLGLLMTSMGVGSFTSAIYLASKTNKENLLQWLSTGSILFAAGMTGLALSSNIPLAMVTLALIGCGSTVMMSTINTLIQLITPNQYRGRVMALFSMMFMGMGVFGSTFAGTSGEYLGVQETLLISAGALIFSCLTLRPALLRNAKGKIQL